ncbi:MAG: aspartate 1-decarboxylase [Kiritimatiellae bacterium]|nr:aspartate 1-decarboxylase [Kiritimatiellia bacterium]
MQRIMLKSKIHRAVLTALELHYEGSISIDPLLMEQADMLPGEQVHVLNVNNGERLVTYVIEGTRNTGEVMLNGPAARLGMVGDEVVIITYCQMDVQEAKDYTPRIVHVDDRNRVVEKNPQ